MCVISPVDYRALYARRARKVCGYSEYCFQATYLLGLAGGSQRHLMHDLAQLEDRALDAGLRERVVVL